MLDDQTEWGWQLRHAKEFDMTDHSTLFPPLPRWEAKGYRPDGYGRWINQVGDVALPLYEGRMIGPFDPSEKGWVSGKGRTAIWRELPFKDKVFEPQYLLSVSDYLRQERALRGNKIAFMRIGSATNTRSMYASLVSDMPCGHSIFTLQPTESDVVHVLSLVACLNSFIYDYSLRCRLGGINLSYFIIAETPLFPPSQLFMSSCAKLAARLNMVMPCFSQQWQDLRATYPHLGEQHWRRLWAITQYERLRLRCILDAIIAELYGLSYDDFAWILRDDPTNPKGFWRVDKEKPKELRQTTLALEAFKHLKDVGLEAFCQEDWQFPSEVAAQLGPRFTTWQEQGTVAESWAECEENVRRIKEIPMPLPEYGTQENNGKQSNNGSKNASKIGQVDLWSL